MERMMTNAEAIQAGIDAYHRAHDQPRHGTVPAAEVLAAIEPLRPLWEQAGEGLHPSWYLVRDLYERLVLR